MTNNNGSYEVTFDDKTYSVSAELKQEGERTVVVSVIDGVKTSASVVLMGHSVHMFTSVSETFTQYIMLTCLSIATSKPLISICPKWKMNGFRCPHI